MPLNAQQTPPRLSPRRATRLLSLVMVAVGLLSLTWQNTVVNKALLDINMHDTAKTVSSFNIEEEQLAFFHHVKTIMNGDYENVSSVAAASIIAAVCNYILREAASLDAISSQPPVIDINCSNPDYALAFTGQQTDENVEQHQHQQLKYIIDVVIFGFDVDYLEIRLAEHYDIVDKFLIIEQDHTLKGIPKPYFILERLFNNTSSTAGSKTFNRFARYMDKIEVITVKVDQHISTAGAKGWDDGSNYYWDIETDVRIKPIEHLRQTLFVNNPTLRPDQVYVIQNDGDEIMTRKALSHFKQCQLHPFPTLSGIEALSTSFKLNVAWMQETYDMRNTQLSGDHMAFEKLRQVLWRPGPSIWRWQDVDQAGSTNRGPSNGQVHLGLGAANHFSSPLHPVLGFVKEISTVDSAKRWPESLQKDNFTLHDIVKSQLGFHCKRITTNDQSWGTYAFRHSSIFGQENNDFVEGTLPWAVRLKPYRYPWLYSPGILQQQLDLAAEVCGHVPFTTPARATE